MKNSNNFFIQQILVHHFEVVIENLVKEIIRSSYIIFNEFMCGFEA